MTRIYILLLTALFFLSLSCDNSEDADVGPKYGDKQREVTLPKSVVGSVNCFVPDYRIPWYSEDKSASIIVSGRQETREDIVRLRSSGITHVIRKFEYAVTAEKKGSYPKASVSFLTFKTYEDGTYYKTLTLPEQCLFYITSVGNTCKIVNIKSEKTP